jgi:hypothetical protein
MQHTSAVLLYAAIAFIPTAAAAQSTPTARLDGTDPGATVPAAKYDSAFVGYRSFRDEGLADWRALNEEVARVGGHIGIVGRAGQAGPDDAKAFAAPRTEGEAHVHGVPKAPASAQRQP